MLILAATFFHEIILNPLYGEGYQFWSGIGSDFGELTILAALLALFKQRNCHVKGCWRLTWKAWKDPDGHTHSLCKRHHPHDPPSADHIERLANGVTPRS